MLHGLPILTQASQFTMDTSWTFHPLFSILCTITNCLRFYVHTYCSLVYKRRCSRCCGYPEHFCFVFSPKENQVSWLYSSCNCTKTVIPIPQPHSRRLASLPLWVVTAGHLIDCGSRFNRCVVTILGFTSPQRRVGTSGRNT